ncbi:hypothetical protein [Virgibacillus phasianinus]|nr:hypothetical protein [Virgibacillus phasianinus]
MVVRVVQCGTTATNKTLLPLDSKKQKLDSVYWFWVDPNSIYYTIDSYF